MWLEPSPTLNPEAKTAIEDADIVVVAPGNLYGSLAPALVIPGMREALRASNAKKVYVCNLVTKLGQTDDFTVQNFADEIERFAGEPFLYYVLYNSHLPSQSLLEKYSQKGEFAVISKKKKTSYTLCPADLIAADIHLPNNQNDPIAHTRTLIRHDPDKIARQLMKIYFEN
jgi:uncharacterized cofD-like protein